MLKKGEGMDKLFLLLALFVGIINKRIVSFFDWHLFMVVYLSSYTTDVYNPV